MCIPLLSAVGSAPALPTGHPAARSGGFTLVLPELRVPHSLVLDPILSGWAALLTVILSPSSSVVSGLFPDLQFHNTLLAPMWWNWTWNDTKREIDSGYRSAFPPLACVRRKVAGFFPAAIFALFHADPPPSISSEFSSVRARFAVIASSLVLQVHDFPKGIGRLALVCLVGGHGTV